MNLLQEKFYPDVKHHDNPGGVAKDLFQDFDFGEDEVLDFDGSESLVSSDKLVASAQLRFYVKPEAEGDSIPMIFKVEFSPRGAMVGVYSLD